MNWKKTTIIFIVAVGALIGVYDVLAMAKGGIEASISHTIIAWAYDYPVFSFSMGFICGHLFWRLMNTKTLNKIDINEEYKNEN
jgi:hypothetical protein